MIEIKSLNSGYDNLHIIKDLNVEFGPCEFVSIIGPNGAGKTTILKSIFNIANIISGSIKFDGEELVGLKPYEIVLKGIIYVPQGKINFPELTVEENLIIGNYLLDDDKISMQNLEYVYNFYPDLKKFRNNLAFGLSGGQQQMLSIARALMLNPKVLLLDEPSLGLSPKLTKEMFAKIKEIANDGTLVLMVEQNARKAMEHTDRTLVLENGILKLDDSSSKMINDPKLRKVFFGGE